MRRFDSYTGYYMRKSKKGTVPNETIREAVIRSGVSCYQIAAFVGWGKDSGPDVTRVERYLGIKPWKNRKGEYQYSRSMAEANALKIIEAINLDPVDFREIGL